LSFVQGWLGLIGLIWGFIEV